MTFPIRPFTEGMKLLPMPAQPLWTWEARTAANRAFAAAARKGCDGDECMVAYRDAWSAVEKSAAES